MESFVGYRVLVVYDYVMLLIKQKALGFCFKKYIISLRTLFYKETSNHSAVVYIIIPLT